jgi:hypothetical protein
MARDFFPGIGTAVASRTILRGSETWGDVAHRVALGNRSLANGGEGLKEAIADGRILLSGRHLQHGDASQRDRNIEVYSNCSTAAQRALVFYLLLNGSGVGSSYDDDVCILDWSRMPEVIPVIAKDHADSDGSFENLPEALSYVMHFGKDYEVFEVPDNREGWAQAVQLMEDRVYEGSKKVIILDFSKVRPKGSPIGGMQDRPSSGPIPLMEAINKIQVALHDQRGIPLWEQAMVVDHYLAEIVLVGGARRAARIAVKWWKDHDIMGFINIKSEGGHWTANNSIGVDAVFWSMVKFVFEHGHYPTSDHLLAWQVFQAATHAQYNHGTGEPAFINLDLISRGEEAPIDQFVSHMGDRFPMSETAVALRKRLGAIVSKKLYPVIVNPCGEVRLTINGGYCVIGDVAAAFCETQESLNEAVRLTTEALIRTNLMPGMYQGEIYRTNRIGVSLTGIHEYAWHRFGLTFRDLIEEGEGDMLDANGVVMPGLTGKSVPFWISLAMAAKEVDEVARSYSATIGVEEPITSRTIKPAGTTSKLFGLTEGAHLPSMGQYLRWVQFTHGDPLIDEYEAKGYPVRRELQTYKNVSIVGFPTRMALSEVMGDQLVTAAEATPTEQIRWLRLLETFWLLRDGGNQISYTLKYDPKVVSEEAYKRFIIEQTPLVRAVSIMPQIDTTAYEYQPEEPITRERYEELMAHITQMQEEIDRSHLDCSSGACPIDFRERRA